MQRFRNPGTQQIYAVVAVVQLSLCLVGVPSLQSYIHNYFFCGDFKQLASSVYTILANYSGVRFRGFLHSMIVLSWGSG